MVITSVESSTFVADTVNFIRDKLNSNIVDPISASRGSGERFVLTSYPERPVKYPIITVTDSGTIQEGKLGMGSEGTLLRLTIEIRIWARNVKERDELFDEVHNYLRDNQITGDNIAGANLFDFNLSSVVNVSESNVKSKVMEVTYLFICN